MLSLDEAVNAAKQGKMLIVAKAIKQRKQSRLQNYDTIQRWRKMFMAESIRRTREEIQLLERRLNRQLRQESQKEERLEELEAKRKKWTREIAVLRQYLPVTAEQKLAKLLNTLDCPNDLILSYLSMLTGGDDED